MRCLAIWRNRTCRSAGRACTAKNEKTGPKAAKAASNVLNDGRTGKDSKTAAGSALSQAPDKGKGKGKSKK